ncbi:DUF5127 and DUF4965 domain-containing protein [Phanerochaete sordida]|uniref:DUF5127 and DUF4965 domain-containing protein n=1 Tax=Phanerochaete sordida TaxID=48140 RepID=A0A9P3GFV2_9APHY|nr:DUF5127 and DUF4965 domain-containing protein [Phanerochaete sordida]
MPLAVRSPYLNAWTTLNNGATNWPTFWSTAELGWVGLIRVDNVTYGWLEGGGNPNGELLATLRNVQVTPTRTIVQMVAGPVDFNVTFLSPIEPNDPVKQSFPFTYISIIVESNDKARHEVQLYSDITTEWLSGDRSVKADWNTTATNSIVYHESFLSSPRSLFERSDQATDGTLYFAAMLASSTTHVTGLANETRGQFIFTGHLPFILNTQGPSLITHADGDRDVLAISMDLGSVLSATPPTVWALGLLRDPVVQGITASGNANMRSPVWRTQASIQEAWTLIQKFLGDYTAAMQRAEAFDVSLATQTSAHSSLLVDLVSLAARQVMASTELTVSADAESLNTTDVRMYMKNVGTTASSGKMNSVGELYSAYPFFLTVNTSYGAWLLQPILEYASSPSWTEMYAPGDLGLLIYATLS